MSEDDDEWLLKFHYDNLIVDAENCLEIYVQSEGLNDLKRRFLTTLPDDARERITTPGKLLEELKTIGKLGLLKTEVLKILAKKLKLKALEDKVCEYELHRSGKVWGTIKGGAQSTVVHLKNVLQTKEGMAVIAGAVVIGIIHKKPEVLELLQNVLPVAMQIIGMNEGSICFMLETSCLSSLRQLWESFVNDSLREKLEDVFNGIPEVRELTNGDEIHVEVMIDEQEYYTALWKLVVSQVEGKSEESTTSVDVVHVLQKHEKNLQEMKNAISKLKLSIDYETYHNHVVNASGLPKNVAVMYSLINIHV